MQVSVRIPFPLSGSILVLLIVTLTTLLESGEAITKQEESILHDYRALGMDESVVARGDEIPVQMKMPPSKISGSTSRDPMLPPVDPIPRPPPSMSTLPPELPLDPPIEPEPPIDAAKFQLPPEDKIIDNLMGPMGRGEPDEQKMTDVDRVDAVDFTPQHSDSQQLWLVPRKEGRHLTKLITAKETSTFLDPKVAEPRLTDQKASKPGDGKTKTLAKYRIMVPIWIPAVERRAPIVQQKPEEVKYVKETHTEMVPVTKNVAIKKTIVKPERVPQKIVTDFVRAPNGQMRSDVDDKLKPDEEIVGSVVTNFQ